MAQRVKFRFSKDYGSTKKGAVKKISRAHAHILTNREKVGKVYVPSQDKVEPKAKKASVKSDGTD